jgi:DUF4097 and DUF4098 domain-containing protein YvlB
MTRRVLTVLLVLIGVAGVAVVGLANGFAPEDKATITEPGPVRSVEVDVEAGRVSIVAGEADAAKVDRTRRFVGSEPTTEERLLGGVLRVTADCPRFLASVCEVDYRIEVPRGVSVKVRAERGSVSVAGITGMVEVDTGTAGVRLDKTRGPVRVNTSAGAVVGVDLAASFLDATTSAGRVRVTMVEAPGRIGLRTGAGSIDLGLPPTEGGYRVDADAGNGKADVTVAENPAALRSVTADSGAGRIRIHPR